MAADGGCVVITLTATCPKKEHDDEPMTAILEAVLKAYEHEDVETRISHRAIRGVNA